MKYLLFLICFLCWFQARSAPPTYTFSRGGDCNLKIERGATLDNSMNLQDLTWREPKRRDIIEVRDYSTSFSCRNEQITNYVADQVDSLIAQLTIWKDSCILEGGSSSTVTTSNGITGNGASATPVKLGTTALSETTTIPLGSQTLQTSGTGVIDLRATLSGGNWSGGTIANNNTLGLGIDSYGLLGSNSSSTYSGIIQFGDFTAIGQTDHTLFRGLTIVGSSPTRWDGNVTYNTATDAVTLNDITTTTGAGTSTVLQRADASGTGDAIHLLGTIGNATGNTRMEIIWNNGTLERALRLKGGFLGFDNDTDASTYAFKIPWTAPTASRQVLMSDIDTDSLMTWEDIDKLQQVDITGVTITVDLDDGNIIRVNSATVNDTIVIPTGLYETQNVEVINRTGVAILLRSNADVNGNSSYGKGMNVNASWVGRWSATEPEWMTIGE